MKKLKPDKIHKYKIFNPNYNGYSKCTGKFETKEEAITSIKNYFVDVMMDDQDGWANKQYIDHKISQEEKDNKIFFALSATQRGTSGHIHPREVLVARIIEPIEWEPVYL